MDRDEVEVHKNVKRERGQYPAILTELAWSIIYTYIPETALPLLQGEYRLWERDWIF